ncbi:DUF599 domain-containing protein [Thalassotalea sp. PLHSN55]|uniref:DUF599 domain-containing protein n=1 Tax=Thalassotalea sp. PLHSN55 TaxID=3435888 RepID=UPI003F85DF74
MHIYLLDIFAFAVFITCWFGYTLFARKKAKTTDCIARSLHQNRIHWMTQMLSHELRVGEASLLANLERNIAFFASTTLLVLAGVLALFGQVEKLADILESIPFAQSSLTFAIQIKLALLGCIFVMAFFQFTWSMRQYGFVNVMIGAAPYDKSGTNENLKKYAKQVAVVQDQAAHAYNYGLRSYYFSLAAICWFLSPSALMIASILVVYTLYKREFTSKAVTAITAGMHYLDIERDKAASKDSSKG